MKYDTIRYGYAVAGSMGLAALLGVGYAAAPSASQGAALTVFVAGDVAKAAAINANFAMLNDKAAANATTIAANETGARNRTDLTGANIVDGSLKEADIGPAIVSSVDGVSSDGGNIDLVAGANVTITPNNATKKITIDAKAPAWAGGTVISSKAPIVKLDSTNLSNSTDGALDIRAQGRRGVTVHAGLSTNFTGSPTGIDSKANGTPTRGATGVRGSAVSPSATASGRNFGVVGTAGHSSRGGDAWGVSGYGYSSNAAAYGVYGLAFTSAANKSAHAIHGQIQSAGGTKYAVYSQGKFGSTSNKGFIHPHPKQSGKVVEFICLEGNENGTYFRGKGKISGGVAEIEIPEEWQLVTAKTELTVHLTPIRSLARLAVWDLSREKITVRGEEDCTFSYIVHGVRRGFEKHTPVRVNADFVPQLKGVPFGQHFRRSYRNLLVENGTLNADYTPNEATAKKNGWQLRTPNQEEIRTAAQSEAAWRNTFPAPNLTTDSQPR